MNTLVKDFEIRPFLKQIEYAYENGIDAVIIQDPSSSR
jgi:collagenase-like PrtC family protease